MINSHFPTDSHYKKDLSKKVSCIRKFINLFRTPAKMEFEHLPYQTRPEVPEAEIDLRALREQRRAAKQSNQ
jgi:hypothetical protein